MSKEEIREYLRELGRRGAKATNSKLSPEQRKESARKAAEARWANERAELKDIRRSTRKVVKQGERLLKKSKSRT